MITRALGGRAAEEVVFGPDEIDSGAESDIQQLTRIIRFMVTQVGMSSLGLVALDTEEKDYSEEVAASIDRQMRSIVKSCYENALKILREHRQLMDILVEELIDKETLDGDEFRAIVDQHTQAKNLNNNNLISI
jgi:cell division protease FtsH